MGIGGMLNNQGGAPSMADQQHPGQAQVHPAFVMDRPNSPHGSEHSRYSGPMNTSYPSPTAMGAQLAQVPSANMGPSLPSLPPNMGHNTPPPGMSPGPGLPGAGMPGPGQSQPPAPKAYPCSTCGKGFARRSDLARHGMLLLLLSCRSPLTSWQSESIVASVLMCVTLRTAENNSSNARLSLSTSVCTQVKSLTSVSDAGRYVCLGTQRESKLTVKHSPSVIAAPSHAIVASTWEADLTSALMPIAKRRLLVAPLSPVTRAFTPAPSRMLQGPRLRPSHEVPMLPPPPEQSLDPRATTPRTKAHPWLRLPPDRPALTSPT